MEFKINESWETELSEAFNQPYFEELENFLAQERKKGEIIYPPDQQIFSAFDITPFHQLKVVILGQDPYHGLGQAHGLAFSVAGSQKLPPSLRNIFKELNADLMVKIPGHGNLSKWAKQGVLLLNTTLTVRAASAGSHQKKGWENFTNAVIKHISTRCKNVVFILWGKHAGNKETLIDSSKHYILKAAHPSPLSAYNGFFGSKPFSKTNEYLKRIGKTPIDWNI